MTLWSIWYARKQSKRVSDISRNEIVSLWAHLDRVRTLVGQIEELSNDEKFIETGNLNAKQKQTLPKIHKGLCDEYVRVVELIVKKKTKMTKNTIDIWQKEGKIKTEWQKQQFMNLIDRASQEKEKNDNG